MNNSIVKIFMASPMDLKNERILFREIIKKINAELGSNLGIEYEIVSCKTHVLPDKGIDAQDVVNHQIIMDYDIFVCFFKDRINEMSDEKKMWVNYG